MAILRGGPLYGLGDEGLLASRKQAPLSSITACPSPPKHNGFSEFQKFRNSEIRTFGPCSALRCLGFGNVLALARPFEPVGNDISLAVAFDHLGEILRTVQSAVSDMHREASGQLGGKVQSHLLLGSVLAACRFSDRAFSCLGGCRFHAPPLPFRMEFQERAKSG
jgi:hypothetical protein